MSERRCRARYVGQVERDPDGAFWAVLYLGGQVVARERVPSLRKGKRRVTDLVLTASDSLVERPSRDTPAHLNRLVDTRAPMPRHRRAPVAGIG